jgi:hypothetical protein
MRSVHTSNIDVTWAVLNEPAPRRCGWCCVCCLGGLEFGTRRGLLLAALGLERDVGRIRSSHFGIHLFLSPISFIAAGTRMVRTMVA